MNEEQAVLDFFAQEENLPLALSVADLVDVTRQNLNNRFWNDLRQRINALISEHQLPWQSELTEDRNTEDCLVGLHLMPTNDAQLFLRPFMEQQLLGDAHRIFLGLMWSGSAADKARLPAITALQEAMAQAGFKSNESFLAWRWSNFHPRRRDFLLRYTEQPEALLDEVMSFWQALLLDQEQLLIAANRALSDTARIQTVPLDQLRSSLINRQTGTSQSKN